MRVILIDGSGFMFRAYHALPKLVRSDGHPSGAVDGFCRMIWKLLRNDWQSYRPATHIGVVFDKGSLNWRNTIYPKYKLNRQRDEKVADDMTKQAPLVRRCARAFNLPVLELRGCEADDLIATYTRLALEAGADEIRIVARDKDMMQFVGPKVYVYDPFATVAGASERGKIIREKEVFEKFGVTPDKVTDAQALIGDKTDNVPGIDGIGEKKAGKLISAFGDLEAVIANANEITKSVVPNGAKIKKAILENPEQIRMAKKLVTMDANVPVVEPIEALAVKAIDHDALHEFLLEMEFAVLANKIAYAFERGFVPNRKEAA
jgi:DNA polymerase-1